MGKVRLHKYLAGMEIGSRRNCEMLIQNGKVKVNNVIVTELGTIINTDSDTVKVYNKLITTKNILKIYLLLHKPKGFLCTYHDPFGRPTIYDLLKNIKNRLNYAGRLDFESEGLVFLTNDGEIIHKITHPREMVKKVYEVKTKGIPGDNDIRQLRKGIPIGPGIITSPCQVKILKKSLNSSILEITISEGKNRQIRKMLDYLGIQILRLKRTRIGILTIDGLKPGEYRFLGKHEIVKLKNYLKNDK